MEYDYDMDDDRPDLPPEAGELTPHGFEPYNDWLRIAEPELRHEAMREWFLTRYRDPAHDTPHDSEVGYIYINGGPYDAEEELYKRFGGSLEDDDIRDVIDDVESDGITEWAPIHEPDYDTDFELETDERENPYQFLERRVRDLEVLEATPVDAQRQPLLRQIVYSSLIGALEAYLADTMSYWLATDEQVFCKFVSTTHEFKQQKLSLSEIFDRADGLKGEVEQHLQRAENVPSGPPRTSSSLSDTELLIRNLCSNAPNEASR
jgi:hypothetical protein